MLFQVIVFNVIFLIFYVIIFLIGVLITRWLAKIHEYNESWLPAISMNGLWFGVTFIVGLLMYFIFGMNAIVQIHFLIALPVNILLGIMVSQLEQVYDIDNYKEAFKFVLINLILLLVILAVAFFVSIFLFAMIT